MKMKKLMCTLLGVTMTASLLAGCGAGDSQPTAGTEQNNAAASEAADAAATDAAAETDSAAEADEGETASGEQVTLTFWSWLPTLDQWDKMVGEFEKENPDIKVEYTRSEDVEEKLKVAMASGTGPDLFGMTTSVIEQYKPFCEPMDALADEYLPGWQDVISPTAVEQCTTQDGTMVGMPLLVAGMTDLLYNQTILDECGITEVPRTYEELKADAELIKAKGYIPVVVGAADDWVNSDWFINISNEFEKGAVYEAEAGNRAWTDQCFVDTMNAWKQLFDDGIFEEGALGVATYPDARDQYFFDKKAAFFLTGSWHLGPTSPSNDEIQGTAVQGDTIGMCVFPSMSPSGDIYATSGVDILLGVNKDSANKEAAMKFVEFMSQGSGQQVFVDGLQGSPVSNQITYEGAVDGTLQQQSIDEVNQYVSDAVGARKLKYSELENAIYIAMQNVAAGGDPETELQNVQAVSDGIER